MQISNRDFLRSYRHWKQELMRGGIAELSIPQTAGVFLKVTIEKKQKLHALDHFVKTIQKANYKGIERPEEDII